MQSAQPLTDIIFFNYNLHIFSSQIFRKNSCFFNKKNHYGDDSISIFIVTTEFEF